MPIDPDIAELVRQWHEEREEPRLDEDILSAIEKRRRERRQREDYLRKEYAWGLTSPFRLERLKYLRGALEEVIDPREQQFLVDEVGRISRTMEWAERQRYAESGFGGRFFQNLRRVGMAFGEGGAGMIEAAGSLAESAIGKVPTQKQAQFSFALEAAKQQANPLVPQYGDLAQKVTTGMAGMAPDLAGGLLANAASPGAGILGYWTARLTPERQKQFIAMGLDPTTATAAGFGVAGAEAGIETIVKDPTGLTRAGTPIGKSFLRRAGREALGGVGRIALETSEEAAQAVTETGARWIAGKLYPGAEGPPGREVLPAGWEAFKEALPGVAGLGFVGGAGKVIAPPSTFKKSPKQVKVEREIIQFVNEGKIPSRKQWLSWGLTQEEGKSQKQREEKIQEIAEAVKVRGIVEAVATEKVPTNEQWKVWNLPDGIKMGDRLDYLKTRVVAGAELEAAEEAPQAAQEGGPGEVAPAVVAPEVLTTEAMRPAPEVADVSPAIKHMAPVQMEESGPPIGGREVVRRLEKLWEVPIRRGRVRERAAGIYKRHPEVVRLAHGEESSPIIAGHEVAHHLEKTTGILKELSEAETAELAALDYDKEKERPTEGFAEFMSLYVAGDAAGVTEGSPREVAPQFAEFFEAWLGVRPDVRSKLDETASLIEQWKRAGAVGRVMGQISETGFDVSEELVAGDKAKELFRRAYILLKDEGYPVKEFDEIAERKGYTPGEETTAYQDYNALRRAGEHFAASAIEDGVFLLSGTMEKVGPSLKEALADIEPGKDREKFRAWTYARHAQESWERKKDPGITLEDAVETTRRLYDPRYERAADMLTAYGNALITVLEDVGEIPSEEAETIRSYYQWHIPLQRAREKGLSRGRRFVDLGGIIKGRRGSGLQIIDPVEALIARTIKTYDRASRRVIVNKILKIARTTEGLGEWVEVVPPDVIATNFKFEEIRSQLVAEFIEEGLPETDITQLFDVIDPAAALSVFRPERMMLGGRPIVRIPTETGNRYIQYHPDLYEALGGLESHHNLDFVTQVARRFMGALKIGATRLNPAFWVRNAPRDFSAFLMQGESGLLGSFDPIQWAASYVYSEIARESGRAQDPVVALWKKMGGELSTYVGLDRSRLKQAAKVIKRGRHGWLTTGMNIAGTTEVASRLAEFAAVLDKQGWLEKVKKGETPPLPVLFRAIGAAHDVTVDFRKMGKWGRYLNYWLPFLNAHLEGLDKVRRIFKDHPARTLMRIGTVFVPLSLLYWWLRHDDDDYKERPEWQDGYWIFPDDEGRPLVRIPKPHSWGLIASGIERMMDAVFDKDPEAVGRWFEQVIGETVPDNYPVGVTPIFETMFNYDHFRKRPIVSRALQKVEPQEQYYDYTSSLVKHAAKFLYDHSGGKIKLSPAKIGHLINGITGGLYETVEAPVEKLLSAESWTASDVPGIKGLVFRREYTKSVDDFYDFREELSRKIATQRRRGELVEASDTAKLKQYEHVMKILRNLRKLARGKPEEKEAIGRVMTGLCRKVLGRQPLERYPSSLAREGSE